MPVSQKDPDMVQVRKDVLERLLSALSEADQKLATLSGARDRGVDVNALVPKRTEVIDVPAAEKAPEPAPKINRDWLHDVFD